MLIKLSEYPAGWWLNFTPETQFDAAQLVRLKLNQVEKSPEIHVSAGKESITATVVIRQAKNQKTYVQK